MTTLTKTQKEEFVKEFGAKDGDTGNSKVQIAMLTQRIKDLTDHLRQNKKDNHNRRALSILIGKRKRLLKYVKKDGIEQYNEFIKILGIRK
ncbi:MAG: 30S ribosomal protein S15 [Candidatus Marinimicrobia bacterium]|nr:30S ribosomal protein S15 [Candidatus Neomarinimicrobiota bacterium]